MRQRSKQQESGRQPRKSTTPRQDFFTYHASRQSGPVETNARKTSSVKPVDSRLSWHRFSTIIVLLVLFVCVGYTTTLTSMPRFSIDTEPQAKLLRPEDYYQQTAEVMFKDSILSKTKLTINTTGLEEQISRQFPELQDVKITLPLMGHRPVVTAIAESPALFVATKTGVYIVGASGTVFANTSDVKGAGGLNLPTVQDEAELKVEVGQGVLSKQDVTFITTLIKQFEKQNITISSLTLPPLASELHVRISGQPYYIKFSLLTDSRIAYGQFAALKKKLDAEGVTPAEYIDSRVEERIYYK